MDFSSTILVIVCGGLLGMLGQSLRAIAGLKKAKQDAEAFDTSRLLVSLLIGFTAGALTLLAMDVRQPTKELWFSIVAAGYAGTDAIEAFAMRYLPRESASTAAAADKRSPVVTVQSPDSGTDPATTRAFG